MKEALVISYRTPEIILETGDMEFDYVGADRNGNPAHYCALICVKAVERDEEGELISPGEVTEIKAERWNTVRTAIRKLGYPAPPSSLVSMKHN